MADPQNDPAGRPGQEDIPKKNSRFGTTFLEPQFGAILEKFAHWYLDFLGSIFGFGLVNIFGNLNSAVF